MTISEDLRAFILADAELVAIVGDNVSQNKIPQGVDQLPAIWFRRSTSTDELTLEVNPGTTVQFTEEYDIEVVTDDVEVMETLVSLLKAFQSHRGGFGTGKVQGLFIDDSSDSYRPTNVSDDDGRHVGSLSFEIVGYED